MRFTYTRGLIWFSNCVGFLDCSYLLISSYKRLRLQCIKLYLALSTFHGKCSAWGVLSPLAVNWNPWISLGTWLATNTAPSSISGPCSRNVMYWGGVDSMWSYFITWNTVLPRKPWTSIFSKYSLIRNKFGTHWIQRIGPIHDLF